MASRRNVNIPSPSNACPCGSGAPLADCCVRFLDGSVPAPTALALMRSRYTAFVLGREAYLVQTWHASTRPEELDLATEPQPRWLGLAIKHDAMLDDDHATVEFVARYKIEGRAYRLHETSEFVREDGRWFYVRGDLKE